MFEPDESVKSWIDIFVDVYAPNQDKIDEASEKIQDKLDNDKGFLVEICTKILMQKDSEDNRIIKSKTLSSILLSQCLEISSKSDIDFFRKIFEQNPEILEEIKNSVKQNILSTNSSIRNKSAQCYSYLVAILVDEWKEGIDEIVNSYSNTDLLPNGFIGLISAMREIVNQETFVDEILRKFEDQFAQTIVFCLNILKTDPSEEKYTPDLRYEACRFIHDIINIKKEIFDTEEQKAGKIPVLLECLQNSFQVNNIDLFSMLIQLLLMIVKQYYEQSKDFLEIIDSYVEIGFEMMSINQDFVNISINFWIEVASLEKKIIILKNIDDKLNRLHTQDPLEPLLSEVAAEKLIPIFLNFIEYVDEGDTSVEDIQKKPKPYMYSTLAVAAFYKNSPMVIFEKVKERIDEISSKIDNWTHLFIVLNMIYSITDEPTNPNVSEYISDKFDLIFEALLLQKVPKLSDMALFVIILVIKNYPEIILRLEDKTIDKHINGIIISIEQTLKNKEEDQSEISNDTLQILLRYSQVIYHLANFYDNDIKIINIEQYFEKFYDILECLFNFGILNNDQLLIQTSGKALNQIIDISTPGLSNRLGEIYEKTLDLLEQSRIQCLPQEIRFIVQSSYCSIISNILLKLKKINIGNCIDIIKAYAQKTLHLIYEILSNENTYTYEEGLGTISSLIIATSYPTQQFYIDLFEEKAYNCLVYDFLYNSLNSLDTNIINSACLLIGNLYYFLLHKIPDLLQNIDFIFTKLSSFINNKEMKETYPFVLKAIANIFICLNQYDEKLAEFEEPLRELLESLLDFSTKLDITNDSDVEYGNKFYTNLTDAFGSYAKVYYNNNDLDIERQQLFLLDSLAIYIFKLYPRISDELYMAFAKTARMFRENCSRRNNVILNRHPIHRLLKLGYESVSTQEGKRFIKEQIEYLKGV